MDRGGFDMERETEQVEVQRDSQNKGKEKGYGMC